MSLTVAEPRPLAVACWRLPAFVWLWGEFGNGLCNGERVHVIVPRVFIEQ